MPGLINALKIPNPLDPLSEYGDPSDPHNQQKVRCKLCAKEIFDGINHLKYHLAQILGYEVDIFPSFP